MSRWAALPLRYISQAVRRKGNDRLWQKGVDPKCLHNDRY
jgi:hypothetical protein